MNQRGQALAEAVPFFLILAIVIGSLVGFTQWFLLHQKLVLGARQAALLYSSGHFSKGQVGQRVKLYLKKGFPAMDPTFVTVGIGKRKTVEGILFQLDEIRVRYRTQKKWMRWFEPLMEEVCVIKHGSRYWIYSDLFLYAGPSQRWDSQT